METQVVDTERQFRCLNPSTTPNGLSIVLPRKTSLSLQHLQVTTIYYGCDTLNNREKNLPMNFTQSRFFLKFFQISVFDKTNFLFRT